MTSSLFPDVPAATKRCVKCGVVKPAHDFSKHPATRDGLQSWCKACVREAARAAYQARR